MTSAKIGYGSIFAKGDGASPEVFTALGEVVNLSHSGMQRDAVEATHMQSTEGWREYIPGLKAGGELTVTLNFIPGNATRTTLEGQFSTDVVSNWKVTFPDSPASTFSFAAICTGFAWENPVEGKMEATATFQITGKPVYA